MEDVQRLVAQLLQPTAPKDSFSFWTGEENPKNATPIPIETGSRLRLVARGTQWSRWSSGLKRIVEPYETDKPLRKIEDDLRPDDIENRPARDKVMDTRICESLIDSMQTGSSMSASLHPETYWRKASVSETSALFGHIVYPTNASNEMRSRKKGEIAYPEYQSYGAFFNSRREFFTNFSGMRNFLQSGGFKKTEESKEEFWIRLMPSQMQTQTQRQGQANLFPSLDLRVDINANTKKPSLASVRLVIREKELDLLLPGEAIDIRFLSESYVPSGEQIDPRISKFIQNSSLDILGEERLKTPTNLTILIPPHAIRRLIGPADDTTNNTDPPEVELDLVEYTFSSLEHRSSISGIASGLNMYYTVIEAGRTGGRREELRMVLPEPNATPNQNASPDSSAALERLHDTARNLIHSIKTVVKEETVPFARRPQLGVSRNPNVRSNILRSVHRRKQASIRSRLLERQSYLNQIKKS